MIDINEIKLVLEFLESQADHLTKRKDEYDFPRRQYFSGERDSYNHIIQMIEDMEKGNYERCHFAPNM